MGNRSSKQTLILALVAVLVTIGPASAVRAQFIVDMGWDLFRTDAQETHFGGVPFEGVPLLTFDFRGLFGVQDVGVTDTIVQRLEVASVMGAGQTDTIQSELVALQLKSAIPWDFGAGFDFHYITLQQDQQSLGTLDITFDDRSGGTFASTLYVAFDLRIGDLNGKIIFSETLELNTAPDVPWGRIPPPGALKIPGVNRLLNGQDNTTDFWPGVFPDGTQGDCFPHGESGGFDASHCIIVTPAPGTLALLAFGGLFARRRRR